jgi:methyltransferase (TIGR00027 family)
MMTEWAVVIRTCLIDDYIRFGLAQGVDVVLNLGAGLDTRPYRMDLPKSLVWIEVDYPDVIEFKDKRLSAEEPRCHLERLRFDLANLPERRELLAKTNARATKILVLTEGVVPYLTVEQVASLADDLHMLDRAAYWILDYFAPQALKYRQRVMRDRMQNAPFRFKPSDWFGFFRDHGWPLRELRFLVEEGVRLNRPLKLPRPLMAVLAIRLLFASKQRKEALKKLVGYAILERATSTASPAVG